MPGSPLLGVLAIGAPFLLGAALIGQPTEEINEVFRFADESIIESSGLVHQDDLAVTVNDSGDVGRVFVVDPETGETVGTTTFADDPTDIEALAPAGAGRVWVGDIGDNRAERSTVSVTRVPYGRDDRAVPGTSYVLTYPDGAHDAETLLAHPRTGRLFVVTKGLLGGQVYAAPRRLRSGRPNQLRPRGPALGLATDGAFFPDGGHVVVRDYSRAVVYAWPSLEVVTEIGLPDQEQGEGLAVTPDNRLLLSSEGRGQPVLEVPLPARLLEIVSEQEDPSQAPAPERTAPADSSSAEVADTTGWEALPYAAGGLVLALLVAVAAVRHWRHGAGGRSG